MSPAAKGALSEEMLVRFGARTGNYDRENRFFEEDFRELRAARYLLLPVPTELGGSGMSLAQVCREQRRLAYYALATALGVNMHLYWVGVAADLWRRGDASLEWILREVAAGEVFAAGHAESGNDIPVLLYTTKADRVEGGYRFTGHKHFGSLSPVWTHLGLHGMDTSDSTKPRIVHAFMARTAHCGSHSLRVIRLAELLLEFEVVFCVRGVISPLLANLYRNRFPKHSPTAREAFTAKPQ